MKFSFEAAIYKVGINPCVDVPLDITAKMIPLKGYIPVRGKIKGHSFQQTIVSVKNKPFRLYINGPILKGSNAKVGDIVKCMIEQDLEPRLVPMSTEFKKKLTDNDLFTSFNKLTAGRQKEILRYLNHLKTDEALIRNMDKVINQLKKT